MRTIFSALFIFVLLFSATLYAQSSTVSPGKGGDGGNPSASCSISGSNVENGIDLISNENTFPVNRVYLGPAPTNGCQAQTWSWSLVGQNILISGSDDTRPVSVDIFNPITAQNSKVKLKHCCNSNEDCANCEITLRMEAPEVDNIFGDIEVKCNSTGTYTADVQGDENFTTVLWTINNPNLAVLSVNNNVATLDFSGGNGEVQLCAKACYGNSNCQVASECITIKVGQQDLEFTSFDDYLCVGTSGNYSIGEGQGPFVWTFNGQVLPGVNGKTHSFDPGASGILTVSGPNECGFNASVSGEITYVTDPPSDPGLILNLTEGESGYPGPLTPIQTCSNTTLVLKVLDIDGPNDFAEWDYENINNLPGMPVTFDPNSSNDMVLLFKYAHTYLPNLIGACSLEVNVNNNCFDSRYNSARVIEISPTGGSGIGGCGGGFKQDPLSGDLVPEAYFQVLPNPAAENVVLRYQVSESGKYSLRLIDARGQLIERIFSDLPHTPSPFQTEIDLRALPNGIYFCVLVDEGGKVLHREKLLVQHP